MPPSPIKKPGALKTPSKNARACSQIPDPPDDPDLTPTANLQASATSRSLPPPPQPRPQESPTRRSTRLQKSNEHMQDEEEFWQRAEEDDGRLHHSASQPKLGPRMQMLTLDDVYSEQDEEDDRSLSSGNTTSDVSLEGVTLVEAQFQNENYAFPPPGMESLTSDLLQISRSSKVVPFRFRHAAQAKKSFVDPSDCIALQESDCKLHLPADEANCEDLWKEVLKIKDRAQECEEGNYSEIAWNCEVHSSLLRCALEGYWKDRNVWYRIVTTHRITEKSIIPKLHGKKKPGSMVDFSMVTTPSQQVIEAVYNKIGRTANINQTSAEDVEQSVLTTNIETKVKILDIKKGVHQLAVWSLAQYNKLQQLNPELEWQELPVLPAILTQQHKWNLYFIRRIAEDKILVQGHITVGTSAGVVGIFQILATIQRLARWSEEYGAWWENNVLHS